MTGEQLGRAFFTYMVDRKPPPVGNGEPHAYIYGADEFIVDHGRSVIIFPEIGEVGFERDESSDAFPEWMAAVVQPNGEQEIVAGYCQPFSDEAKDLLPHVGGAIRAMPYWIKQRFREPRVQKMMAKIQPRQSGSGGFAAKGLGWRGR